MQPDTRVTDLHGDYRDHLYRRRSILPKVERTRKRPGDIEFVYERGEYVARKVAA